MSAKCARPGYRDGGGFPVLIFARAVIALVHDKTRPAGTGENRETVVRYRLPVAVLWGEGGARDDRLSEGFFF